MMQIIRSTWLVALVVFAFGCGSGDGGDGGDGGNGGNGGTSSTGSTTGKTCEQTCSGGDDCDSVPCSCEDGSVVNTQSCNNGCCLDEAAACPGACEDKGGWSG